MFCTRRKYSRESEREICVFVSLHIDVPDVAKETEDAEEDDDIVSGFAFAPPFHRETKTRH